MQLLPDQLWQALPPDDQHSLLQTLSQLLAKQLHVPPGRKEDADEDC
jgi:hypothetical protein